MLYLQAGVHLQEEELPVLVQELDGARAPIVDRPRSPQGGLAHRLPLLGGQQG